MEDQHQRLISCSTWKLSTMSFKIIGHFLVVVIFHFCCTFYFFQKSTGLILTCAVNVSSWWESPVHNLLVVRCPFWEEHWAVCQFFFVYMPLWGRCPRHVMSPHGGLLVAIGAGLGQMVCSNGPPMYKSIWHLGQDVPVTSCPPHISATAEGTDLI